MAPVTRRSARIAQETTGDESVLSSSNAANADEAPLVNELASPLGKRKSTEDNNEADDEASSLLDPAPASPKRQRLAVRTREDESTATGRKTYLEVEIPVSTTSRASPVPDSQDVGEAVGPELEPSSASKQLEEEATQRLASLEPEQTSMTKPKPQPKGKHITFGDDDDVDKFVAAAATADASTTADKTQEDVKDNDEGSDDDDEAPEAVSTQAVAKEMQKAAQFASEAADKQAASLKRKRQEKDSLYKLQAERRKRVRGVQVHQTQPSAAERASSSAAEEHKHNVAEVETAVTFGRRQRAEKLNLPAVLPAEFLTDSSSDEDEDDAAALKKLVKKPKKINFEDGGGKTPRDMTVGSTRYRVLAKQADEALAPRAHRSARVSKESLLKRRRAAVAPGVKKGFFVKR
ncbi:hypothetical protein F4818DRAFT_37725 [Hypoxylon cercidicola]|nr:hypothetical protein F4818DRAFT_37725 [Hypoxylon cercidicola]